MTIPSWAYEYGDWSDDKLFKLVRQRDIDFSPACRDAFIAAFRKLSRPPGIHFLDFPPEIRNVIYGELLTPVRQRPNEEPATSTCHPAILRICRQVYSEASEMLYATTPIPLCVKLRSRPQYTYEGAFNGWSYNVEVSVNGWIIRHGKLSKVRKELYVSWPKFMSRMHCINLTVESRKDKGVRDQDIRTTACYQMNHVLYQIHKMLSKSPSLRCLDIDLVHEWRDDCMPLRMLSPLFALPAEIKYVTYTTNIPDEEVTREIEDATDDFRKVRALKAQAELRLDRSIALKATEATLGRSQCTANEESLNKALALCSDATTMRRIGWWYTFATSKRLNAAIDTISKLLNDMDAAGLRNDTERDCRRGLEDAD